MACFGGRRSPSILWLTLEGRDSRLFALPLAENQDQESGGNAYGETLLLRPSLWDSVSKLQYQHGGEHLFISKEQWTSFLCFFSQVENGVTMRRSSWPGDCPTVRLGS